jgi:hypothetical protein
VHDASVQSAPSESHPALQGQLQCVVQLLPQPPEHVGPKPPVVCVMLAKGVMIGVEVAVPLGNSIQGQGFGVIDRVFEALGMQEYPALDRGAASSVITNGGALKLISG